MIKSFKFLVIILMLQSCAYQPVHLNKNYNFKFVEISTDGDKQINNLIKGFLKSNTDGGKNYKIHLKTKKKREVVTSDTKGDPEIYKLEINLDYQVFKDGKQIIEDQISKQITYNSIKDKFELSQYENNIIKNLSNNISNDVLFAIEILNQ